MGAGERPASFDRELDAADEAIAVGDWARVAELADAILAADPDQVDAIAFRSLARRQLAKRSEVDETERRFLTVVFVDLVGSTVISDTLDPEEFAALLERYHGVVANAIVAFGGSVVKLFGDGVMAQFGYPRAIEDAPRRACLAALQLVDDVAGVAAEIHDRFGVALDCRVGIHSGTAVVQGGDVLGDVPNTSAKLEGIAPPGGVAVSDETRSLLEGLFRFDEIEAATVVGTAAAYELVRPERVSASVRRAAQSATDLVGRSDELASLERDWRSTTAGAARVVAIVGPAGIGKSRLTEEFCANVMGEGARWIEGGAVEFRSGRPFHLFTDAIERQLVGVGIDPYDTVAASTELGVGVDEVALLTTVGAERDLTPAQVRRTMITSITDWIDGVVASGPTVLALEDLHWADPSSIELAGELAATADRPLLILVTSRVPVPLPARTIELDPLTDTELDTLMGQLCSDLTLADDARRLLADRAGGVPLFAHELARTVRTIETPDVERLLPGSLRDLLASRLDSFGRAKRVAQLASVFGRAFTIEQIAEIDDQRIPVVDDVATLVDGALVESTSEAGGEFRFAHSLMQDAAYESLLRSERRELHARAAAAIEHLHPETARRSPDLIAHHLTEARETRRAFDRWMEAGRLAGSRSASNEAIGHFRRAEGLLADLPESERDDLDYAVQVAVASPLTAEHGYAAPEVETAYRRAADLADGSGDPVRRFAATRGLASTYLLRAEISRAADLGSESLRIARETGNVGSELEALTWLGTVEFFAGRLDEARDRLAASVDMYEEEHRRHGFEFGIDPRVLADTHRAWLLQLDGDRETALDTARSALEHARSLGHALSVAHALNYLAGLRQMRGEHDEQLRTADEEVAMAIEYGFVHYIHYGRIFAGHAQTHLGDRRAVVSMTNALADRSAAGAALARPYQLYLIADGRSSVGDPRGAIGELEEAIDVVARTGETWWEPAIAAALAAAAERLG